MTRKSEVYTWRVSPAIKVSLEEAARNANRSVASLLDEIVAGHLDATTQSGDADNARQRRLHERVARFAGRISGNDPRRAEEAAARVRTRLHSRRAGVR